MTQQIQKDGLLKVIEVEPPSGECDCILIVEHGRSYFRTPCMVPVGSPLPSLSNMLLVKNINENDGWISAELLVNTHSEGGGYTLCGLTKIQQ